MTLLKQFLIHVLLALKALLYAYIMYIFVLIGLSILFMLGIIVYGIYKVTHNKKKLNVIPADTETKKARAQFETLEFATSDSYSIRVTSAGKDIIKVVKLIREQSPEYSLDHVTHSLRHNGAINMQHISDIVRLKIICYELIQHRANFILKNQDGIILFDSK